MNSTNLKCAGLVLMLAGMAGVGITAAEMLGVYKVQADSSASALAEGIGSTLLPATIGGPMFLAGLGAILAVWWRGRGSERAVGS
ncbi:MAG: hypothetical protein ACR2RV_23775 [Verrucomicrobiales bacterium]